MAAQEYQAPESVGRLQQRALFVGGVALPRFPFWAPCALRAFYQSYLMSFLLLLGLTVGSLGLVMAPASDERPLGYHHPPPVGIRHSHASTDGHRFLAIAIFGMQHLYSGHGEEKGWLNAPPTGQGALSDFQKGYLTTHGYFGYYTRAGHLFCGLACC